jgi:PAS domain S-box-containing protein
MKDLNHLFGRIPIRTKLLILTLGLASIPLLLFFLLTFMVGFSELKELSLNNLEREALAIRDQITAHFNKIEQDVRLLSRSPVLHEFIRNRGAAAEGTYRRLAERNLVLLAESNPAYHQLRYIDASGRERLRIEQADGHVTITPPGALQDKRRRYYFQEAIRLGPEQTYVSPMDYNVEHDRIEEPKRPVFRYAALVETNGETKGVFIINVFGNTVLDMLRTKADSARSYESLSLQDEKGRVIVTGNDSTGAMNLSLNLEARDAPAGGALDRLLSSDSGWLSTAGGEFLVRFPVNPKANDPSISWTLVLRAERMNIIMPFYRFGYYSLAFLVLCALAGIVAGLLSARHFYRPLLQLTNGVKRVAGSDYTVDFAIDTNDELEDLAKDFTMMAGSLEAREQEIRTHQRELEKLVEKRTSQIALEKEKLERVVEGVGAGLVLFDENFALVWCNEYFSRLLGLSQFELGDRCCRMFSDRLAYCGGGAQYNDECAMRQVFAGRQVELPMREIEYPDGQVRVFLDRISPIRNSEDKVAYALHILYDVTEKQQMEAREQKLQQQLTRAEKLATLGRFTAGISHEVGNPLGIMFTNAQAIQENLEEDSVPWRQMELILSEIQRLSNITKNLNTFAKPSPPNLLFHNPADILTGLKRLIDKEGAAHNVRVVTNIQPYQGMIRVDAQQLQQVILNLVVNAFEAMPDGGELCLGVRQEVSPQEGARLLFTLADTGMGIPEENLETIFDPFYTTKPRGSGFGLALANTMVNQSKGNLTVASTPGEGSVFTIALPLHPPPAAARVAMGG